MAGDTSTQDFDGLVMMMMMVMIAMTVMMMRRIVNMMMLFVAGGTSILSFKISMKMIIDHSSLFCEPYFLTTNCFCFRKQLVSAWSGAT